MEPIIFCKILNKSELDERKEYYQLSFDEISLSLDLGVSKRWEDFFEKHPTNSLVYLVENGKIVSYIYATPYRDYLAYDDTDLMRWHINYLQTHKNFQRRGYATQLLSICLMDIMNKGGKTVSATPNYESSNLIRRVIERYNLVSTSSCGVVSLKNLERLKDVNGEIVFKR